MSNTFYRTHLSHLSCTVSAVLLVACAAVPSPADAQTQPELPSGWTPKEIVYTKREMVSAANPFAVKAGADILAAGGNAWDANIATQMVLNLVEPQSSGIGGGAFMVSYKSSTKKVDTWDGRETAPLAATPNLFIGADGRPLSFVAAVIGGRSVGTPGLLRALEASHKENGKLAWATLFEPAIKLSEEGFAISPRLFIALGGANAELKKTENAGAYFFNADGTPKAVGTVIKNPAFAATLRAVASGGADAFYKGAIADAIVAKVKAHPSNAGLLEAPDMQAYKAIKREPVCGMYRGRWRICGMNMPSSGPATVLATLGILENFNVAGLKPDSVEAVHLISEAYRLAYADRALYMADPDFICVPVEGLIDKGYLRQRSTFINLNKSIGVPTAGAPLGCGKTTSSPQMEDNEAGTSHLSIVDAEGNAISMTTTIESAFGSHQFVNGFLLNNQLTDFNFAPTDASGKAVANRLEPGKRPRSSMAPVMVFDMANDGKLHAVVGSPGGSNIIQYVTKTLVGLLDWNLDIQQAINLGNFGAQTSATTSLERASSVKDLGPGLTALGHTVSVIDINSGIHGVTTIRKIVPQFSQTSAPSAPRPGLGAFVKPLSGWAGGADPRREGTSAGR